VILRFWGAKPKGDVKPDDPYHDLRLHDPIRDPVWIERFEAWMRGRGSSPQTRNHYRSVLRGMYKTALLPAYRTVSGVALNPFRDLRRESVVGIHGVFDGNGALTSVGIQCALCHSTVDQSFSVAGIPAGKIGHRLDGWPNRDLNVGAIVALSPDLSTVATLLQVDQATVRTVLNSWGPGKFDAELFLDGKAFRPDGRTAATLLPPAFGLAGVNMHTYTGWGSVPYWNAFVANLEMHGSGTFYDPRLNNKDQFPVAARAGFGNVRQGDDGISSRLAALQFYQLAMPAPKPAAGSFDARAADHGQTLFNGPATCSSCHVPPLFTEPGWAMHTGDEIGIDDFQANRSPEHRYRTTPLRGLWTHQKGGFYHDGRFPTLLAVVQHYNQVFNLRLSDQDMFDLTEYLKSL
jgi:cytochrome c553